VVTVTALLDTLPLLSVNGVDKVYHQLKYILDVTAAQQAQSSLQRQAEVSILSPGRSGAEQQKATTGFPGGGGGGGRGHIPAHSESGPRSATPSGQES
jgi:hypothetical protein